MMPKEDGSETPCKVEVEYEWVPPKCKQCMSLGHATATCPDSKKTAKPTVAVYVQKRPVQPPRTVSQPKEKAAVRTVQHTVDEEDEAVEKEVGAEQSKFIDKGKAVVVYNPFDALLLADVDAGLVTLADSISDEPWIVGGDFNTVLDMSEVCAASADIHMAMNEFRDCILGTGLIHLPVQVAEFALPMSECSNVRSLPSCAPRRYGLSYFTRKLRALEPVFRTLRKKKGDLSLNVKLAVEFLGTVQQLLQTDRHNTLLIRLEKCCKLVFLKATKLEQIMLQQRAKIQWLKGGDQCSRIFFRNALVQSVTREEIKDAFFDIAEDKAPGRLLRQVHTTILALIPKVRVPSMVSDFRPISCYNVLYKVVTKIIVQRLRIVLDKLISPSQNAFVPGRSIVDNILLAQELFTGYNRQGLPKRCALKVDLRKAYDTVESDFLSVMLQLFGFPGTFIGWIEECVTTPMFSVCINGNPHGFFKGSRGLRQGDPMSPFLFVLIMEVLHLLIRMRDSPFTGVARSLVYFNFALPMTSFYFVKPTWLRFRCLDKGWTNFYPVQHRMSGSTYLQHFSSRRVTFHSGWESIQLSFARRLQLIKSVVMALNVYWAMAFILQKGVIREVEKKMRTFLWKGNSAVGYPKVAWSVVCRPIEEGGQGIRDMLALNKALMSRHLWNVIQNNQSSIWVKWITHTRLRHKSVWTVDVKGGSWGWRKLLRLRSALLPYIEFKIGDGESFSLWHDPWHSHSPLITRFPRGPGRTNIPEAAKLSAVLVDGDWSWPLITDMECIEILHLLTTIHNGTDSILWRGGNFSTKAVYDIFRIPGPQVGWYSLLVGPCKIPRYSFVLWMAILDKLSTMDKPWLSHLGGPNRAWGMDITWASRRWNGRHIVQMAYRALLAAIFYHIWQERNRRVFQYIERTSSTIASIAIDEIRQKILNIDLPDSVSSRGLYRLWRIPWPVRRIA
ncbi:putative ribonuclease H protein [Sesamum angolense]|uniref:Ribonuclease H protein n=1 Tax=Sesamum angolense TaxID=2727404 RepID=A0AAE1T3U0_9LAMI|nr:putative ribonuclease H protein [Sesamum angolense]